MNIQKESAVTRIEISAHQHAKHVLWFISLLFGAVAVLLSLNANAADHAKADKAESECFSHVQDKIKWDYDHTSSWEPHNIKQLCRGTVKPKQPGECFHAVMHGGTYGNDGINWGGGTRWEWRNAANLCSGANDANKRISCFKGHIKEGHKWQRAISECLAIDR